MHESYASRIIIQPESYTSRTARVVQREWNGVSRTGRKTWTSLSISRKMHGEADEDGVAGGRGRDQNERFENVVGVAEACQVVTRMSDSRTLWASRRRVRS